MRRMCIAVLVAISCQAAVAADTQQQQVAAACRAVVEANFRACTEENIAALLATISKNAGSREEGIEFVKEAKELFAETDLYIRLTGFRLDDIQGNVAYATVNQLTLPADEKDRRARPEKVFYRHHSAMLPEWEEVQYTQKFVYENGRWLNLRMISEPKAVGGWSAETLTGETQLGPKMVDSPCANGRCPTPFITVR